MNNILQQENIRIINSQSKEYPFLLKQIYNPPPLYIKGHFPDPQAHPYLAVIGARKYSIYGKQIVEQIVKELAARGITIVSGMALGIDALAHHAAIEAGGQTVAVLGTGIDDASIYPTSNRGLAQKIIRNGAIISEFPIGTPAFKGNFPQRNRLVSGLSLGTLVVEAGKKSGTLITAQHALEQNREVFAVPGNIFHYTSEGANELLKKGAIPVTSASDVLDNLGINTLNIPERPIELSANSEEEKIILQILSKNPVHINQVIQASQINASNINSVLLMMEMEGKIKNLGNMYYIRS